MFEYCTWLTNAAGDKQGSLSLRSNSMAFFLDLSPKYSSQIQNEWEFSCIAQQRQPFPLKTYQILQRVFQKIKVLYIQNALVYPPLLWSPQCSARHNTSLKMLPPVLFFIYCMSHLVQWKHSSECKGGRFFQRIISNKTEEQNVLLFHLLLWRISPHLWPLSKVKTFGCTPSWF